VAALLAGPALGRVQQRTGYTRQQVFNGAMRYLRVDQQYKVLERDEASGYLLFEYPRGGDRPPANASLEVIETDEHVTFVVQIPQLPEYHEQHLAEGLARKLREDYGEPARKKERPDPAPRRPEDEPGDTPDQGEEGDDGDEAPNPDAPPHEQVPRYRIKPKQS
jgi:hypothetical protein